MAGVIRRRNNIGAKKKVRIGAAMWTWQLTLQKNGLVRFQGVGLETYACDVHAMNRAASTQPCQSGRREGETMWKLVSPKHGHAARKCLNLT